MEFNKTKKEFIVLVLILVLASFFRFFNLNLLPPGVFPDEAINANQALKDPGRLFYPENNGREGLFINLLALSTKIFGASIVSFRIVPAFFGTLTVLGIYLLGKELFSKQVGFISSFLLAVSFWHVNFSRILFRAVLAPFSLTFTFYFLIRGFRKEKPIDFILAGIFYGAGFHSYISYRLSVLIFPFLFWWEAKRRKEKLERKLILKIFLFLTATFLTALPIGIYFLQNPEHFLSRAGGVSIFNSPQPLWSFLKSLGAHLAMFNVVGDPNWRHNIAGRPVLFWPTGILFLTGVFYSFKHFNRPPLKKEAYPANHKILLIGWLIMLIPGILTFEGIPHSLRTICSLPFVFLLAGAGFNYLRHFSLNKKIKKSILTALLFLLIFFLTGSSFFRYFKLWGAKEEVKESFTSTYVKIGEHLNSEPDSVQKYVIVNRPGDPYYGLSIAAQTPELMERIKYSEPRAEYIPASKIREIKTSQETIFLPLYPEETIPLLQETIPHGETQKLNGFSVYRVQKQEIPNQ